MTDKSVLIIPTPRDCEHCDLPFTIDEILGRVVCWEDEHGKHCPLKPLPERQWCEGDEWSDGFNACLEMITGEKE